MAGMIGMAQTLAVYHYGYHTLKNRLVQYHEALRENPLTQKLEWGLNTPFTSQDKPPLAIAMVVTNSGVRSLRRYRLVIAQKAKLRLTQEVTAALASQSRDHRLTASGFFPCSIDREYLYMAMQGTDIALRCGFVLLTMDLRFLSTGSGAAKYTSIRPPKTGGSCSYRVSIISMLTDCNHCCCRLLHCKST